MSSPRIGIDRPETNSVITMTTNGTASVSPCFAHSGHQSFVLDRNSSSDWSDAERRARRSSAIHSELSRAISATASAGTTSSVRFPGVRTPIGGPGDDHDEAHEHRRQHPRDHAEALRARGGRTTPPARSPPRPGWRGRSATAEPDRRAPRRATTTTPINQSRSTGTGNPATVTVPVGSTGSRRRSSVPYFSGDRRPQTVTRQADGGDHLGQHGRGAQRSGDGDVHERPERRGDGERDDDRHPRRQRHVERRHPRQRQRELAPLEVVEHVQRRPSPSPPAAKLMTPVPWYVSTMLAVRPA